MVNTGSLAAIALFVIDLHGSSGLVWTMTWGDPLPLILVETNDFKTRVKSARVL